jgi:hypothetical protein
MLLLVCSFSCKNNHDTQHIIANPGAKVKAAGEKLPPAGM